MKLYKDPADRLFEMMERRRWPKAVRPYADYIRVCLLKLNSGIGNPLENSLLLQRAFRLLTEKCGKIGAPLKDETKVYMEWLKRPYPGIKVEVEVDEN